MLTRWREHLLIGMWSGRSQNARCSAATSSPSPPINSNPGLIDREDALGFEPVKVQSPTIDETPASGTVFDPGRARDPSHAERGRSSRYRNNCAQPPREAAAGPAPVRGEGNAPGTLDQTALPIRLRTDVPRPEIGGAVIDVAAQGVTFAPTSTRTRRRWSARASHRSTGFTRGSTMAARVISMA